MSETLNSRKRGDANFEEGKSVVGGEFYGGCEVNQTLKVIGRLKEKIE
jgi:hypothetical protein